MMPFALYSLEKLHHEIGGPDRVRILEAVIHMHLNQPVFGLGDDYDYFVSKQADTSLFSHQEIDANGLKTLTVYDPEAQTKLIFTYGSQASLLGVSDLPMTASLQQMRDTDPDANMALMGAYHCQSDKMTLHTSQPQTLTRVQPLRMGCNPN